MIVSAVGGQDPTRISKATACCACLNGSGAPSSIRTNFRAAAKASVRSAVMTPRRPASASPPASIVDRWDSRATKRRLPGAIVLRFEVDLAATFDSTSFACRLVGDTLDTAGS